MPTICTNRHEAMVEGIGADLVESGHVTPHAVDVTDVSAVNSIIGEIGDKLSMFNVTPLRKVAP